MQSALHAAHVDTEFSCRVVVMAVRTPFGRKWRRVVDFRIGPADILVRFLLVGFQFFELEKKNVGKELPKIRTAAA